MRNTKYHSYFPQMFGEMLYGDLHVLGSVWANLPHAEKTAEEKVSQVIEENQESH